MKSTPSLSLFQKQEQQQQKKTVLIIVSDRFYIPLIQSEVKISESK